MKCFRRGTATVIAGLFVVFIANAQELKTAPAIMEFSSAKMGAYKTLSADYSQSMNTPGGEIAINGRILQKQPHKMRIQLDMPMIGQNGKMTIILGEDGMLWQIMQMGARTQIMKADMNRVMSNSVSLTGGKFNPLDQMDPSKQWETSKGMYDFKVVAPGEIDGQRMYVMEGSLKSDAVTNPQVAAEAANISKMRVSIGRDDGFVHRMEMYDKSLTNLVTAMEFKNLKLDADIPDSTFAYQPPAGAQVTDITAMFEMRMRASQGGSTPAAPEAAPTPSAPAVPKAQ